MPEGDRFEESFGAGWRAALVVVEGGVASDAEVADKLVKALAKTLRANGGVPGLLAMAEIVESSNGISLLERFSALDAIARAQEGHRHTKVATDVAKSLVVQNGAASGGSIHDSLERRLVGDTCAALVSHYFFERAQQQLIAGGRFADTEDARRWQVRVEQIMEPAIAKIAERLVRRPDAEGLRAPKRNVPMESTHNLLYENLNPIPSRELSRVPG